MGDPAEENDPPPESRPLLYNPPRCVNRKTTEMAQKKGSRLSKGNSYNLAR
jgi:hypothetical protein